MTPLVFTIHSNILCPYDIWTGRKTNTGQLKRKALSGLHCPGLDHIFIRLGPTPPTPPSLPDLPARTYMGTPPRWEPMWQYLVKTTNIQVDITLIIPKLINEVPSNTKGAWWLKRLGIVTLVPNGEGFPCKCGQEDRAVKEAWEGWGPAEWRCDLAGAPGYIHVHEETHINMRLLYRHTVYSMERGAATINGVLQTRWILGPCKWGDMLTLNLDAHT